MAALVILIIAVTALPAARTAILRTAGWALVAEDPLRPVDVVIVTAAENVTLVHR